MQPKRCELSKVVNFPRILFVPTSKQGTHGGSERAYMHVGGTHNIAISYQLPAKNVSFLRMFGHAWKTQKKHACVWLV